MASTMKYGVGIVGAGWVSGEHIKAFDKNPNTYVAGIYSRRETTAAAKLKECNVSGKIYKSYEEMLNDPDIKILSICTPPDLHCEQVIAGAKAGMHMVIEKPLAMTFEDVKRMEEEVKKAGVKTVVSFVLRWNPMFETTRKLIDDDAVGSLMYLECDYWHWIGPHYAQYDWAKTKRAGGDSLLSAGCHAIDALRLFGGEIDEVFAYSAPGLRGSDYEFDPNLTGVLKFKNGAIGKISSMLECKTPYVFNVHILGDKGTILNNRLYSHKYPGQSDYLEYPTILPDSGDVTHHPFELEINHFMDALINSKPTVPDIFDSVKTMEVCFAMIKSAETGQPVKTGR